MRPAAPASPSAVWQEAQLALGAGRQQAQSAYRKAGLSGRADLSAFFLEDLLLPSRNTKPPEP